MSNLVFVPGDYSVGVVLAVPVMTDHAGVVIHKGILADGVGEDRWPSVVHKSKHFSKALETTMTEFASRSVGPIRSEGYPGQLPRWQVLERARRQINQPWSLTTNCEHFVTWVHGFVPHSPQLRAGVAKTAVVAGIGALIVAALTGGRGA